MAGALDEQAHELACLRRQILFHRAGSDGFSAARYRQLVLKPSGLPPAEKSADAASFQALDKPLEDLASSSGSLEVSTSVLIVRPATPPERGTRCEARAAHSRV